VSPPLFYIPPTTKTPELQSGDEVSLPKDEAHHAATVMRLEPGALVLLVDGLGMGYRAELTAVGVKHVTARVHAVVREFGEPRVHVTLAAGLSVGSKLDAVVQRATELGVKRVVPLVTAKSKVKLDDPKRARSRQARLTKVAVAAMKQCRRSLVPSIAVPTTLGEFLTEFDRSDLGLMFHPSKSAETLSKAGLETAPTRVCLLVGPESGFADEELERAIEAGFRPISLGERILRTETAGPAVVALVMHRLGELS
jgi:16S rRNA (uracil1498-N3)-methyltransferase